MSPVEYRLMELRDGKVGEREWAEPTVGDIVLVKNEEGAGRATLQVVVIVSGYGCRSVLLCGVGQEDRAVRALLELPPKDRAEVVESLVANGGTVQTMVRAMEMRPGSNLKEALPLLFLIEREGRPNTAG